MADFIKVTQVKSTIAEKKKVRKVCDSMGLGKIGKSREYKDNNCIRGMVNKINHLVKYELISK
ncbi:MAG: 50S ribosomal protein L30 [Zetaproteobacteria bacterium]|nr:50S ribosomal protein L30 [Pseudobdellovibrionaceae bacterium]|tara:strand:+ start:1568 stop:1756 length:189 start_codon:yes stop_codon:yes gene_type:complete